MAELISMLKAFFGSIGNAFKDGLMAIRSLLGLLSQAWGLRLTLFQVIPGAILGIVIAGLSVATAKILVKR